MNNITNETETNKHNKSYTNGTVQFRHAGMGKWHFTNGSFTLITPVKGRENAEKVANVVSGSLKRTGGEGLDGLGRANIRQIVGSL